MSQFVGRAEIRVSCRRHDWTEALFNGEIVAPDMHVLPEAHARLAALTDASPALDFMELGLMTFAQAVASGVAIKALPVFIRAAFRHSYIFVNDASRIVVPRDLEGKRVGTRYEMTANVWARALLQHEYGVDLEKIRWVNQVGNRDGIGFKLPPHVQIETVAPDVNLQDWLVEGKIDALIHPDLLPMQLLSRGGVRRLFADAAAEERKSYARTHIVPVMNVIAYRRDADQAVVRRVFNVFARAKESGLRAMEDNRDSGLLWYWKAWEDQVALVGRDPVPYALSAMRPTLEAFVRYARAQGLLERAVTVDDMFAPF